MKYFSKAKSIEEAKILYKKLALENHPDKGGETATMQEINAEFELAFSFLKHQTKIVETESAETFTRHFYSQNGWEGSRYDSNLRKKDICKIMREYVKNVYPIWKFSTRMDGYNSIYISVMEAPMDVFTAEGREKFYKPDNAYIQLNHYYLQDDPRITDYCKVVLKDVLGMLNSYNYDDSDSMVDYFSTNFYVNLHIGKYDKPFQVVEKTARINTTKETKAKRISA
jgi:hypothetical protein